MRCPCAQSSLVKYSCQGVVNPWAKNNCKERLDRLGKPNLYLPPRVQTAQQGMEDEMNKQDQIYALSGRVKDLERALSGLIFCMEWHGRQGHFVGMDAKLLSDAEIVLAKTVQS